MVIPSRFFHGQGRNHHQHVVLNHIPNRPSLFIEAAATVYAEPFGHRDLHAFDVVAVQGVFKERISETEIEEVLDGFFSEVVVDTKNGMLRKVDAECVVERLRRSQVSTKGFSTTM